MNNTEQESSLGAPNQNGPDEIAADKKNANFIMFFRHTEAFGRVRELVSENPTAASLFFFIAQHMDRSNALVASHTALAEALDVSRPTISRAVMYLQAHGFAKRFRSGGTLIFVLNPDLVWRSWRTGKRYCLFHNAKVLLSESEQVDLEFEPVKVSKWSVAVAKPKRQEFRIKARPRINAADLSTNPPEGKQENV